MEKSTNENPITIFDAMIALAKRKWFIIIFTAIFSIAAVVYVLVVPEKWQSSSTFVTITDDMSASNLSSSMLGGLGLGFLGGISSEDALQNIMFLDSRDFKKRIVRKFDLINYYEIEESDTLKALDIALKALKEETYGIYFDKETNGITVNARTKSQQMSKDIVDFAIESLEDFNLNRKTTKGKLKKEFLEKRVNEIDTEFNELVNQLKDFQEEKHLISVESQTIQILEQYSELLGKKTENQIALNLAKAMYNSDVPAIKELELKAREIDKLVNDFEKTGSISKFFVPLDEIPDAALQYTILEMKLKINRKIYEFVYPQYELAKIEAIKDLPTIEITSSADLQGLRVYPKRALMCIITFMASLIISCALALTFELISDENKSKFNEAVRIFLGRNGSK